MQVENKFLPQILDIMGRNEFFSKISLTFIMYLYSPWNNASYLSQLSTFPYRIFRLHQLWNCMFSYNFLCSVAELIDFYLSSCVSKII